MIDKQNRKENVNVNDLTKKTEALFENNKYKLK
jgi:hypothetical protein